MVVAFSSFHVKSYCRGILCPPWTAVRSSIEPPQALSNACVPASCSAKSIMSCTQLQRPCRDCGTWTSCTSATSSPSYCIVWIWHLVVSRCWAIASESIYLCLTSAQLIDGNDTVRMLLFKNGQPYFCYIGLLLCLLSMKTVYKHDFESLAIKQFFLISTTLQLHDINYDIHSNCSFLS